ncbi:MAG: peptidylprolyl isomerase [Deltaproteobacteria bacterium]|nr:peptidylprolyl isomerase [Deltaproteobacteria bacterium]MCB9785801.1 peptidylprolyl isomerase [Deltaproteobacteria bacterium]
MTPALAAILLLSPACRAPRDPDLERRVAEAAVPTGTEAPPAAAPAPEPAKPEPASPGNATVVPKAGEEEVRTLSDEEIQAILAAVPGQGPVLSAILHTERGDIHCTLDAEAAPQTVANFVALATAQRPWRDPDTGELMHTPLFDGLDFHRIISGYIAQTGNPGGHAGGPGWRIPREAGIPDAYDGEGIMGMVDAGDDTHGSQFFITLRPAKSLSGRYTPFGRCGDLGVVRTIADAEKKPVEGGKTPTRPVDPVRLEKVEVLRRAAE